MKKLLLTLFCLGVVFAFAQKPLKTGYTFEVRTSEGVLVAGQTVSVRTSVLQGSETGTPVVTKDTSLSTDAYGRLDLKLSNNILNHAYTANAAYYLKVEVDPANGTHYSLASVLPMPTGENTDANAVLSRYGKLLYLAPVATSGSFRHLTDRPTSLAGYQIADAKIDGTKVILGDDTLNVSSAANDATITIRKNGAEVDNFTVNTATDKSINIAVPTTVSELTDADNYPLLAEKNVYTDTNDFTGGVTLVSGGFVLGATPCTRNAVNACDLQYVFDSIQRTFAGLRDEIDDLRDTLQRLRAATAPRFNDMSIVPTDSSLQVTADFSDGGATITEYNFCISASSDMGSPTCDTSTTNSHTFTGLDPGTTYYVTVAATNLKGTTTSSPRQAQTAFAKPELREPVTATPESNTEISVQGSLENMGGAPSVSVKVCAYTTPDYSDTPICGSDSVITSAPKDYKVSVNGLTKNTHYYLAVIADNGQKKDTVLAEATTLNITISITSNRADTIIRCGSLDTTVTYTANVTGITSPTYAWKVNGSDSTAVTGNTLTVRYTGTATSRVVCTVHGVSDTAVTVTKVGVIPTLVLCEEYAIPSVTVTGTDIMTASLVWKDSSNATVLTGNATLSATTAPGVTAGYYTVTGVNSSNCAITGTARLGNTTPGCLGIPRDTNEIATNGIITQVKDHQGNAYDVVSIGGFCIMKQNLRCTTSPNPSHTLSSWANARSTTISYYFYDSNYGTGGYLYNWRAALDTTIDVSLIGSDVDIPNRRGLCPQGWHLPISSEWESIVGCHAAGQFAAETTWNSNNTSASPGDFDYLYRNVTGFSALAVGHRDLNSSNRRGQNAYFWSATSQENSYAYFMSLFCGSGYFSRQRGEKYHAYSVRCVRD